MNYKEQYQHPKWQKRRLEILERDQFVCQKCGDGETMLHVHHKVYYKNRNVWDYKDFDLVTLCKHCHYQIEKIKPSKSDFNKIKIYKSCNWTDASYIMFISLKDILRVNIFDVDDQFLIGYNIQAYELYNIGKVIKPIVNRWRNG